MSTTNASVRRRRLRVAVLAALAAALVLWWAAPASAHVNATGTDALNGRTQVTFSFDHGCDGSPTTRLRVQLPPGTTDVQAQAHDGFNSNSSNTELDWTGGSIPDHEPATFTATMVLQGARGDTVFFPTIQYCESGQEDWIDQTPDASAPSAAPRIQLPVDGPTTTTTAPATTTTAVTTTTAPSTTTSTAVTTTTSTTRPGTTVPASTAEDSGNPWPWIILILVAAVGAAIIGVLLYQRAQAKKADQANGNGNGSGPTTGNGPGTGPGGTGPGGPGTGGPGGPGTGTPPTGTSPPA